MNADQLVAVLAVIADLRLQLAQAYAERDAATAEVQRLSQAKDE